LPSAAGLNKRLSNGFGTLLALKQTESLSSLGCQFLGSTEFHNQNLAISRALSHSHRMITSSKFNTRLATMVQAASSLGLRVGSGRVSPTAISCWAALALAW